MNDKVSQAKLAQIAVVTGTTLRKNIRLLEKMLKEEEVQSE